MISLAALARLYDEFSTDLERPVTDVRMEGPGGPVTIGDAAPVLMSTLNLSRDSTYRESVAVSTGAAIRKGLTQHAQGAGIVDIGAESTNARARRVAPASQAEALVPVIEALSQRVIVSLETYHLDVVAAGLAAGARVLNLTGREHEEEMLTLAAEHDAAVIICFCELDNVRDDARQPDTDTAIGYLVDHFGPRLEQARSLGVRQVVVDPGLGFYYGNLVDPTTRVRHQARVLAECFRLRTLGVPICNALPHAFDLFEDEFRKAEGFFAVLASLGGTHLFRTHEVPHVRAVLEAMATLEV